MPSNAYRSGVHASTHKSFELLPNTSWLATVAASLGLTASFEVHSEVDSTQTLLLSRPAANLPTGLVCVTHHQSAGRGRLERSWETQPGDGLMFSVVLRPQELAVVPLMAGIAAASALRHHVPSVGLKWPNDLVTQDDDGIHKIGGMVAAVHPEDRSAVVVGIGINFLFSAARPTTEAAALGDYLAQLPSREAVLIEILVELARLETASTEDIVRDYRELCLTLGQRVRVHTVDGDVIEGTAVEVSIEGLTIGLADGSRRIFSSADVQHLRNS